MMDMTSVRAAQQAQELRDLGFTGPFDKYGDVTGVAETAPGAREKLTGAVLELLRSLADGHKVSGGDGVQRPLFYLQTTPRNTSKVQARVDWFATAEDLAQELTARGFTPDQSHLMGWDVVSDALFRWGPVPPALDLAVLPDRASVICWPQWWISGPGHRIASLTPCAHGYHLTDSCPNCDADQEADETTAAPTGRERDGEHWNARMLRWERLREIGEGTVPTLERHAAEWSPVEILKSGDPDNAAVYEQARADLQAENDQRKKALDGLKNQVVLALQSTRDAMNAHVSTFAIAVRQKGALRAVQLHAKEAARLDITERVWARGATVGGETEDWVAALHAARSYAFEQLRHNATARTRNRVDNAMAQIMVDALSDLIDAMDAMLAKVKGAQS